MDETFLDILALPSPHNLIRERSLYCAFGGNTKIITRILEGDNDVCKKNIRIGIPTFRKLVHILPEKHHGWNKCIDVICYLYWLAETCSYRTVSNVLEISRHTVKTIIHRVLDEILALREIISHGNEVDYEGLGNMFCRRAKTNVFKKCIGAIDGTHIRIRCPKNRHDEYYNYKHFYSIQAQVVSSSQLLFTDVFVGYPGSVHDSRVFRNSPLYRRGNYPPEGYFILGDG
uniref:DDE Tnp4 domain-containing protein n=1 Tax=Megaselia scalaris TaxID=36166 RepID=T1GFH7_MEGSC